MVMRRQFLMCGLGLLAASLLPVRPGRAAPERKAELVILIWPDYLDAEVVKAFEASRKVTIRQIFFDSDQARDQQVINKGSDAFDVMVVNGANLPFYAHRKWVVPLDQSLMVNVEHVGSQWIKEAETEGKLFGIPYFWGNIGLAYREDLVPTPPVSWLDFFQPAASLRGRLNAIATNRELFGIALKALGHSVNAEDPAQLAAAEDLLLKQKPYVRSYSYIDISKESPLVTGEVALAMVYNGDALKLNEYHPQIRYVNPSEGSAMWVDFMAVGTSETRRKLAMDFIDFIQDPAMALRNAQALHFATPNQAALRQASSEYLTNPIIFPPREVLQHSESIHMVTPRTQRRMNDVMARLLR